MKKVVVIGGGMAGLTAAWHLSGPKCRDQIEVTVYQRGWRLGGKGASSRGAHGRIEEHGLHVWLGYYDNAFRLMRRVYAELDRPRSDPSCVISGFGQAFSPMQRVGLGDNAHGDWSDWIAGFSEIGGQPGNGRGRDDPASSPASFVRRALILLMDFAASLSDPSGAGHPNPVVLSGSPDPPATDPARADRLFRLAEIGVLVAALESLRLVGAATTNQQGPARMVLDRLRAIEDDIAERLDESHDSRAARDLADLVATCVRGIITDRLLTHPDGLAAINHLDLREWLRAHGAREQTYDSALVKGLYDLAFAYRDGDFRRPGFAAGQGLLLAGKMFFEYRGAIFWRMQAGMGDIVFAPIYQALKSRGVRFEFFHRLDQLHLGPGGASIDAVTIGRQAELRDSDHEYQPLVRVGELPCFPDAPIGDQLIGDVGTDLEYHWSERSNEQIRRLEAGKDFDAVILAVSIGMIPHTCSELLANSARWRAMVDNVSTVPTQSLQLWLRPTEAELGWPHSGSAVAGYQSPFDTYASMSHLVERESWPDENRPGTIAYFCSAMGNQGSDDPEIAHKIVKANAVDLITGRIRHFWPAARRSNGEFDWTLLQGPDDDVAGGDRLDSQYWRANVDPSDRYVQSMPGSLIHRLRADRSGFRNLFLAGDWIDNGHNGGCIEAAAISGIQAANAVRGRPLTKGVLGDYRPGA